ncbi:MAG: hypothetical protein JWQ11_1206, partial [Rhizobacter sp.]|nr:hypothetical protein [Rhizobacter sp.]
MSMYENWWVNLFVVAATAVAVMLGILVHYEGLLGLSRILAGKVGHQRLKVLYAILALLLLHVAEIWIFGVALWGMLRWPECGALAGTSPHLFDAIYFSAITFSTVGYGDMAPVGPVR